MKIKGKISSKIVFVVIPILILTSLFIGLTAYYTSRNGITSIAKEFLGYKLNEIYNFTSRQYNIIKEMNLVSDSTVFDNLKNSIIDYSKTVIGTESGIFLAINTNKKIDFASITNIPQKDIDKIIDLVDNKSSGWLEFSINGKDRVGVFILYSDWGDYFIISEDKNVFYSSSNSILKYVLIILLGSIIISSILLMIFITYLTKPINEFVNTIKDITDKMDLTRRVKIYYEDEIGHLAFFFNNMIAELESAYNQIKNYAYQTVLAKNKEERIRFVFQKYVPSEVINKILNIQSDSMLIGNKQIVSILFSDIRSFTTISESMTPEELVLSLNAYFSRMGIEINKYHGIIDKFIGDAIMAIFGAPVSHGNDAENSVNAALNMIDALVEFNKTQTEKGKITFKIGVGINTGEAIVGNIGSETKIDYTVIGDTVNLASRLEGLSKKYHARIIISEFTKDEIKSNDIYFRELDNVRVKGKVKPVKIYEPFRKSEIETQISYFEEFNNTLYKYYNGNFKEALEDLEKFKQIKPDDYLIYLYKERCEYLLANPPESWDGVETWTEK